MNLTEKFLGFALLGAEWVMWLLVFLSVLSVSIMVERWRWYRARRVDIDTLTKDLRDFAARGDIDGATKRYGSSGAMEAVVGLAGVREAAHGADATAEAMLAARAAERPQHERGLAFLGTLGNNAPFIGLFGTCLGVIQAFDDLAKHSELGERSVMSGVSESLVATAVGLLVALPAVVAFNSFQRRVRLMSAQTDAVAHSILAELRADGGRARGGPSREAA